jgi:arginine/ornithine N-succinyltransferase beta subunit
MAIYAATLPGRTKRVLVRADNQTEASRRFVTVEALTADMMQDALDDGETVWKDGDPFPADEPEAAPVEAAAGEQDSAAE